MSGEIPKRPVVMSVGGLDPSGAGGLLADACTVASMGAHCTVVITTLTVQHTMAARAWTAMTAADVAAQARAVLDDMPVAAIKLGMLGSAANAEAVHGVLRDYPHLPVVLHAGAAIHHPSPPDEALLDCIVSLLCPHVTVLAVDGVDARLLCPEADSAGASAQQLMSYGCQYVLLSGTREPTSTVVNHWYGHKDHIESMQWERLQGEFAGGGCALTAAIAALLAHAVEPFTAATEAQSYTHEALRHARRAGRGRAMPQHLFWAHEESTP